MPLPLPLVPQDIEELLETIHSNHLSGDQDLSCEDDPFPLALASELQDQAAAEGVLPLPLAQKLKRVGVRYEHLDSVLGQVAKKCTSNHACFGLFLGCEREGAQRKLHRIHTIGLPSRVSTLSVCNDAAKTYACSGALHFNTKLSTLVLSTLVTCKNEKIAASCRLS